MVAWRTLALAIIPLVALFLVASWMMGGFGGIDDAVKSIKETAGFYLPEVKVGADKLTAEKFQVSEEHNKAIKNLVKTINQMITSKKTDCFMNYRLKDYGTSGLPVLGEGIKGTIISFSKDKVVIGNGKDQQDIDLTKELTGKLGGFQPCVIAGEGTEGYGVPFYFQWKFLTTRSDLQEQKKEYSKNPYFKKVNWISLYYSTSGFNNNQLDYGNIITKDGSAKLEDGGWLFKAADNSICFFPTTILGRSSDTDGLARDFLGTAKSTDTRSIKYLLDKGELNYCN